MNPKLIETVLAIPAACIILYGLVYFLGLLFGFPLIIPILYATEQKGSFILCFIMYNGMALVSAKAYNYMSAIKVREDLLFRNAIMQFISAVVFFFVIVEISQYL